MLLSHDTYFGSIRIEGPYLRDSSVQSDVSRLLGSFDTVTSFMPPSAILVVRSLTDPLPGTLLENRAAFAAHTDWKNAFHHALANRYQQAVRPEKGRIFQDSDSVVFLDEAEFIACLLLDLTESGHTPKWWWKTLARRFSFLHRADYLKSLLVSATKQVPAIFSYLVSWNAVLPVIRQLSSDEVLDILQEVCSTFKQEEVAYIFSSSTPLGTRNKLPNKEGIPDFESDLSPDPPWDHSIQSLSVFNRLPKAHAILLGISLLFQKDPGRILSKKFIHDLQQWYVFTPNSKPANTRDENTSYDRLQHTRPANSNSMPFSGTGGKEENTSTLQPRSSPQKRTTKPTYQPINKKPNHTPLHSAHNNITSIERIDTRYGGIFFLVNLMEYLCIPSVFEEDWALESQAGSWYVLICLARSFIAQSPNIPQDAFEDPIWPVLAALSNQADDESTIYSISTPEKPELPSDWLDDMAIKEAYNTIYQYKKFSLDTSPTITGMHSWLTLVLPYASMRLGLALELPEQDSMLIADVLIEIQCAVYITPTHLDIVYPLESASAATRKAGLDQDPGWLPSFGRVIKFHFE